MTSEPKIGPSEPKIGLVGYCTPTGLGYENRRAWRNLGVSRWLVWPHADHGLRGLVTAPGVWVIHPADLGNPSLVRRFFDRFLADLDVLLCYERPFLDDLFEVCAARGIRTVLMVNPEWRVGRSWETADLLIARTRHGLDLVRREVPDQRVELAPAALDSREFHRPDSASTVTEIGFSNGWGGVYRRKGWPWLREAVKDEPIHVWSQADIRDEVPIGCIYHGEAATSDELLAGCQLAVQPSRFEGVGYGILEPMARGIPVVTTDAAPMNEPVRGAGLDERFLIDVDQIEEVSLWRPWLAACPSVESIREKIAALRGVDLTFESQRVFQYAVDVHGESAWRRIRELVRSCGG